MSAKYTISVVTFTQFDHAKRCVASIFEHSTDFELLLTVQGNPESLEHFQSVASDVENLTVLSLNRNMGFIEPSRRAFQLCQTPFFVLLNDDAEVSEGWLDALEKPFNDFPKCALSSPVGGHFGNSLNPDKTAVEYLWGHCMMGRTDLLNQVGLFSAYLNWAYWEEIDLGFRLLERGYSLHITPDCHVKHVGKATSAKLHNTDVIFHRNACEVVRRFPRYFGRVR